MMAREQQTRRPRQPCSGLALAAAVGISLVHWFPAPPGILLAIAFALGIYTLAQPRTLSCLLFAVCAFAALHEIRRHDSGARAFAEKLQTGSHVVQATGVVWSEPEQLAIWSRSNTGRFQLKLETVELGGRSERTHGQVMVHWAGVLPGYGDRVSVVAGASNLEPPRNPGQFDSAAHYRRSGIYSELRARYASDCLILSRGHGLASERLAIRARAWMKAQLALDLHDAPEVSGVMQSILLGLKSETGEDLRELFKRTGTMHLFAVSGLHVGMLAFIFWTLLKVLRVKRAPAVLIIVPLLAGYALITGWSPSCVRAAVMASVILCALLFERQPLTYNSLGAAALLILAWDTDQLFAPGFQFSFVLVLAIVLMAGAIQRSIRRIGAPDPFLPQALWSWRQKLGMLVWSRFAATLGVTLSAWIGSLLFTAGYFHLFSPAAILANLFAVLLAFCIVSLALLTVLNAGLSTWLAVTFNNANFLFVKILLATVQIFAKVPGGHFYVELPKGGAPSACEFTVLDLEGGGATHLRAGGHDWLLDCGSAPRYERIVLPYLRSRGVNWLDGLLLTHGDAQHVGGALAVLNDFAPRQIIDSLLKDRSSSRQALHAELARRRRGKALHMRGDRIALHRAASLRVLFPPAGLRRTAADDKGLVVMLEAEGKRALFMADSGFATEQWLLQHEPDLQAELLVKGEHAKDLSGTTGFLTRVQPQAAIVSGPGYGSSSAPLDAWEQSARALGIEVFRQDRCGAVQVELRNGTWELRGFFDGQTFRSRAR
jgi:ComEC/Rec2-related protein